MSTLSGKRYEAKRKEIVTALNRMYRDSTKTPQEISEMADAAMKKHIAGERGKLRAEDVQREWKVIGQALASEIHAVRTRLSNARKRQKLLSESPQSPAVQFYKSYLEALERARDRIDYHFRLASYPPSVAIVDDRMSPDGLPKRTFERVPFGHSWVDWVDVDDRRGLRMAHAALEAKTRRFADILDREPFNVLTFKRDTIVNLWTQERNALLDAIDSSHVPRPHEEAQVKMIDVALAKLEAAPLTKKVNKHWRRMLSLAECNAITREVHEAHKEHEEAQAKEPPAALADLYGWEDFED